MLYYKNLNAQAEGAICSKYSRLIELLPYLNQNILGII